MANDDEAVVENVLAGLNFGTVALNVTSLFGYDMMTSGST